VSDPSDKTWGRVLQSKIFRRVAGLLPRLLVKFFCNRPPIITTISLRPACGLLIPLHAPSCEALIPFSIRPYRCFPVQCSIPYNTGPFLKLPLAC